jgi:hypothetical protein
MNRAPRVHARGDTMIDRVIAILEDHALSTSAKVHLARVAFFAGLGGQTEISAEAVGRRVAMGVTQTKAVRRTLRVAKHIQVIPRPGATSITRLSWHPEFTPDRVADPRHVALAVPRPMAPDGAVNKQSAAVADSHFSSPSDGRISDPFSKPLDSRISDPLDSRIPDPAYKEEDFKQEREKSCSTSSAPSSSTGNAEVSDHYQEKSAATEGQERSELREHRGGKALTALPRIAESEPAISAEQKVEFQALLNSCTKQPILDRSLDNLISFVTKTGTIEAAFAFAWKKRRGQPNWEHGGIWQKVFTEEFPAFVSVHSENQTAQHKAVLPAAAPELTREQLVSDLALMVELLAECPKHDEAPEWREHIERARLSDPEMYQAADHRWP